MCQKFDYLLSVYESAVQNNFQREVFCMQVDGNSGERRCDGSGLLTNSKNSFRVGENSNHLCNYEMMLSVVGSLNSME